MWLAPARLLRKKVWDKSKAADTGAVNCWGSLLMRFRSTKGRAQDEQLHPKMRGCAVGITGSTPSLIFGCTDVISCSVTLFPGANLELDVSV